MRLDHLLSKEHIPSPMSTECVDRRRSLPVSALASWFRTQELETIGPLPVRSVLYPALRERHVRPFPQRNGPTACASSVGAATDPQATAAASFPLDWTIHAVAGPRGRQVPLENCTANTSIFINCRCICNFQATKSQRWMPWRLLPKKDVDGCEKPR